MSLDSPEVSGCFSLDCLRAKYGFRAERVRGSKKSLDYRKDLRRECVRGVERRSARIGKVEL